MQFQTHPQGNHMAEGTAYPLSSVPALSTGVPMPMGQPNSQGLPEAGRAAVAQNPGFPSAPYGSYEAGSHPGTLAGELKASPSRAPPHQMVPPSPVLFNGDTALDGQTPPQAPRSRRLYNAASALGMRIANAALERWVRRRVLASHLLGYLLRLSKGSLDHTCQNVALM